MSGLLSPRGLGRFLACLAFAIPLLVHAQSRPDDEARVDQLVLQHVEAMQKAVQVTWPQVGTIWPGASFEKVAMVAADGRRAWLLTPQAAEALTADEARALFKPQSMFSFSTLRDKDVVVMNIAPTRAFYADLAKTPLLGEMDPRIFTGGVVFDERAVRSRLTAAGGQALQRMPVRGNGVPLAFNVGVHEAFHHYVQSSWSRPVQSGTSRYADFPVKREARKMRFAVLYFLLEDTLGTASSGDQLAAAAHWYQRWRKEALDDARLAQATDTPEGSARYFDVRMDLAAMAGWADTLSPQQRLSRTLALELADLRAGRVPGSMAAGRPSESYLLGALAGLAADRAGIAWKAASASTQASPAESLLGAAPAKAVDLPVTLLAAVDEQLSQSENRVTPGLRAFLDPWQAKDGKQVLVAMPMRSTGSSQRMGMFKPDGLPDAWILHANLTGDMLVGSGTAEFRGLTTAFVPAASLPCASASPAPYMVAFVPAAELRVSESQVAGTGAALKFAVPRENAQQVMFEGRSLWCLR